MIAATFDFQSEEVDFLLLDGIIDRIKKREGELDDKNDTFKLYHYSLKTIRPSVRDFMKNCCDKIANHRVEYSRDKVSTRKPNRSALSHRFNQK